MKALTGIKVIDFSKWLPGQYCGMVLGDFGADVIKVETPAGDDTRRFFPEALPRIATVLLFFRKRCHGLRRCFFFSGSAVTDCDSASFSPEALSRIVMSLPICFIYRDILG